MVAPFPYFGGKRRVAAEVWRRFGDVANYVEPFFGSGAVLLNRPASHTGHTETVNDAEGMIANFWRAVRADPDAVAHHADWPVNETDLHARHAWLVTLRAGPDFVPCLEGDPEFYDAKVAGWWVWGACAWIGSGWCSGRGPWRVVTDADGLSKLAHLGNAGQGINRQLAHLGDAGQGINRQLAHLGDAGRGEHIAAWMRALSERLRDVRVGCGDWGRITTESVTTRHGLTGVFLDPPYAAGDWTPGLYATEHDVAVDVAAWAAENGNDPRMRVALCGYDSLVMPDGWTAHRWKAHGGYGGGKGNRADENSAREVVWFSPHCIGAESVHVTLPMWEEAPT